MLGLKEKTTFDDLTYHYKDWQMGAEIFHDLDIALNFFEKIMDSNITLEKKSKQSKWV